MSSNVISLFCGGDAELLGGLFFFTFGYAGSSLLQGVFSSFSNGDYSLVAVGGLLIAVISPVAEVGLQGSWASAVAVPGL